jgi:hypothetical protein
VKRAMRDEHAAMPRRTFDNFDALQVIYGDGQQIERAGRDAPW